MLRSDIQEYIDANIGEDISQLALKKNPFPDVAWSEILQQIASKTKAKSKLPTWYKAKGILWPGRISVEQTSSEVAALYKASVVSGQTMIDVSGGFGIDDYYFANSFEEVVHCELDSELSVIVAHNLQQLHVKNISCIAGDSTEILKGSGSFDWLYADPARRHDSKGKVFKLADCQPDVPSLLHLYFEHTDQIMVKTSPLLDLTAGMAELKNVSEIYILAIRNEVKELLWILKKNFKEDIQINAVNILKDNQETFRFKFASELHSVFGPPEVYLYEPNSAIMKSGGFSEVGKAFHLKKLHKNTHLYTSNQLISFPGRRFKIRQVIPYTKSLMKAQLFGTQMNVTVRNFPDTVEALRKKWKITDGGSVYCFFTTDVNENKIVLICTKID